MRYPCGEAGHPRILGTKDDHIYSGQHGQDVSIVIEYRSCGCITWRYA